MAFPVPSGAFRSPGWLVDARGILRDVQSQDPWPEHGFERHINTTTHDCFMVVHGRQCMVSFPVVIDEGNRLINRLRVLEISIWSYTFIGRDIYIESSQPMKRYNGGLDIKFNLVTSW